jgi:hypothetical protein
VPFLSGTPPRGAGWACTGFGRASIAGRRRETGTGQEKKNSIGAIQTLSAVSTCPCRPPGRREFLERLQSWPERVALRQWPWEKERHRGGDPALGRRFLTSEERMKSRELNLHMKSLPVPVSAGVTSIRVLKLLSVLEKICEIFFQLQ